MLDVKAMPSDYAGIMSKDIQYTIRNVSKSVDGALRRLAVREGASLNAVALEALKAGAGVEECGVRYHDLDALVGTWVQDDVFDKAIEAFESIDKDIWK
jgi:hypothetical protein